MDNYDPGDLPLDDPLERRRRRRRQMIQSEVDDAWAAADADDIPDEQVEIEDLAAGYVDEPVTAVPTSASFEPLDDITISPLDDPLETPNRIDLGPLPNSAQRLVEERRVGSRYTSSRAREPIAQPEPYAAIETVPDVSYSRRPGRLSDVPFWGILLLVFLGLIALLVVLLAIASVVSVLG